MGFRENFKNVRRLEAAAQVVESQGIPSALTGPELSLLGFLLMRFKHHGAGRDVLQRLDERMTADRTVKVEVEAFAETMQGVSEADFKTIQRPEIQSAFAKLGV